MLLVVVGLAPRALSATVVVLVCVQSHACLYIRGGRVTPVCGWFVA